ncbi:hypothetical protein [Jidongwangia harbinensis]|uniref:hypothetical protein n=1 Tax=Jidongwangia harbinensis TaxID=2878561 RepID=UPI001CDA11BF|nr:hypothetical protein [Jidongwangia harbinensis]
MKDYLPLIGTVIGAVLALVGVWIAQRRTDKREAVKFEHDRTTKEREDQREKVQRLRPNRVELLFEVGKHLTKWSSLLIIITNRAENDESYEWNNVTDRAIDLARETDDLGIRFRLLFSEPFDDAWDRFAKAVDNLRFAIEHAPLGKTNDLFGEDWERERWIHISQAAFDTMTQKISMDTTLRAAMRQIDTE